MIYKFMLGTGAVKMQLFQGLASLAKAVYNAVLHAC